MGKQVDEERLTAEVNALKIELKTAIAKQDAAQKTIAGLETEKANLLAAGYSPHSDGYHASAESQSNSIQLESLEADYYDDERKELVLGLLRQELVNNEAPTRRYHLIKDIVDANAPNNHRREEIEVELRRIFWDLSNLSGPDKKKLENLGFELIQQGNHYKVIYRNDHWYQFTFAKSASDRRAGRNNFTNIRGLIL